MTMTNGSRRVKAAFCFLMAALLACWGLPPLTNAYAIGEDAGSWELSFHGYEISGGYSAVNGGVGYRSEDGDIGYCYDYDAPGPSNSGTDYTHLKRGTTVTDYVVAKGYPNTNTIAGESWSDAKAQAITQLAAWLASGTVDEDSTSDFEHSSDSVVRAADTLYREAKAYKGGDPSIDGSSSVTYVDGRKEIQAILTVNLFGHISLTKVSANPGMTKGNALYPLAGHSYGIYTDKACTKSYHGYVLNGDAAHDANLDLVPGSYYVKEKITPKAGTYTLDSTVYTVKVKSGKTTKVNGGSVADTPQSNALRIVAKKHDADTQAGKPWGSPARRSGLHGLLLRQSGW